MIAVLAGAACERSRPGSAGSAGGAAVNEGDPAAAIQARLASAPSFAADDPEGKRVWKAVRAFYEKSGFQPAWFEDGRPRPQVKVFGAVVANAAAEGLNPLDYDVQFVENLKPAPSLNPFGGGLDAAQVADADVRLTYTFSRYADHLLRGRVRPGEVDKHWFGNQRDTDVAKVLQASLTSDNVQASLSGLAPRHPQYDALRQALARYREIAGGGGWPVVPQGALALRPGKPSPHVVTLQKRLALTGDFTGAPAPATPDALFDDLTREAVKTFERRHGFKDDGLLDKEVLAALNVPVSVRLRQMELNLERWRWLPEDLGSRHILVNIPSFQLTGYENGQPTIEMRVVAGKPETPTPIFSDVMSSVVFSPYWNIPPEIAREETIPAVLRDPGYLSKNNLEVVRNDKVVSPGQVDWNDKGVRFRQRPGTENSLGLVKFLFPNKFDVYLHDTPADNLFARVGRDYSHGCVRVENPLELTLWVLRDQPEWTAARIDAAMHSGEEKHLAVKSKLPVHIVYHTAWVGSDGRVMFHPDVYGHDEAQVKVLPMSPPPVPQGRVAD
jgi:L,D-transpeptidase YcbB